MTHSYFTFTGGTQRLARIVGPSLAKELVFTARIIDGIDAEKIGLVNHVVKQNDTNDAAFQRAVELAQEISPQVNTQTMQPFKEQ